MQKKVKSKFKALMGYDPVVIKAPGRINLIGEHTDYNLGWVLPGAIEQGIYFGIGKNNTDICRMVAMDFDQSFNIDLNDLEQKEKYSWVNYLMGVIKSFNLSINQGFDLVFTSNLPIGAGLSSSAALTSGCAWAINYLFDLEFNYQDLALKAQWAEHEFVGVKCGLMDQTASLFGKKDHLMLMDCQTNYTELLKFILPKYKLLLCNSQVKHELASTEYNVRRQQCDEAVKAFNTGENPVYSLRDVDFNMLKEYQDKMDPLIYKRARYVIEENRRVLSAVDCINNKNYKNLGMLLWESHEGLKNDYEVSCPELDYLVELSLEFEHAAGARMMGGGFGGCTLNMIKKEVIDEYTDYLDKSYYEKFEMHPEFYPVNLGDGVRILN